MPRRSAVRLACLALGLSAALSGCNAGQLQFHNDHRLSFRSPGNRALVTVPVTVSWTMKDFDPVGLDGSHDSHQGIFAVFVDRAPMPVGKDLKWLARDDKGCVRDPRCPDAQYLADRGVHLTTEPTISLDVLPQAGDGVGNEQHYVNVVLIDGSGHRIGESAWYRPFQSKRRSSS